MKPQLISIDATVGRHGNIINYKKGEPIKIMEGAKFKIIMLEDDLIQEETLPEPLTSQQQKRTLELKYNVDSFKMVLKRGTLLYFRISRKVMEDGRSVRKNVTYTVMLLEDLFVLKKKDVTPARTYALFDAQCQLVHNEKPIRGKSLNQIYSLTFKKLYNLDNSSEANATVRFFTNDEIRSIARKKPAPQNCVKWYIENYEDIDGLPIPPEKNQLQGTIFDQ